jgi:hypothetical protein
LKRESLCSGHSRSDRSDFCRFLKNDRKTSKYSDSEATAWKGSIFRNKERCKETIEKRTQINQTNARIA